MVLGMRYIAAFIFATLLLYGCDDEPDSPLDATSGEQLQPADQGSGYDGGPSSAVDFVVQGCATKTATLCQGTAPLTLTFSAVLLKQPTSVTWDFGDNSKSQPGLVVTHVYSKPGTYDVTLTIGDNAGTLSEQKFKFVQVAGAAPGDRCAVDDTCTSGKCVCNGICSFPLADGLCLESCGKQSPCSSSKQACVDLSAGAGAKKEPWRTRLCLPRCTKDKDCERTGFSCRLAPGVFGWHKVCLPPFPGFVGAPCKTSSGVGVVDHSRCLGGVCQDLGAAGYCTAQCVTVACPPGTRCARFTKDSKQTICLLKCDGANCAGDPLLACEIPSQSGQYGFEVTGPLTDPKGTRYCAPRRCKKDNECGLAGICDAAIGGFCALKK